MRGKAELVEGSALFCPTLCWGVGDGPSSFQQGGDDTVATCLQNIKKRRKKKRSLGLVKKTQESCFTADAPDEAALSGAPLLPPGAQVAAGKTLLAPPGRLRAHVTWFGRVIRPPVCLSPDGCCLLSGCT